MNRFRHALAERDNHILTLRAVIVLLCLCLAGVGYGWYSAPQKLTLWFPPDLRSGSTRPWWEVPPASVYTFTFYIFQQLNRWPVDGEEDYSHNIHTLSAYLTPGCHAFLLRDYQVRRDTGELRKRVRGLYEIPGRGYGDDPTNRVRAVSDSDWIVKLDVAADEYYSSEQVKRALVRYSLKVTRQDNDPERNPFGLALNCYAETPQRITLPESAQPAAKGAGLSSMAH